MTFDPFDDELWVPDHLEWAESSNQNLAARKEEWKKNQPSLKELAGFNRTPSGYLSVHKSLFLKVVYPKSKNKR